TATATTTQIRTTNTHVSRSSLTIARAPAASRSEWSGRTGRRACAKRDAGSDEKRQRLLDEVGERSEELGAARSVERTMVAGQREHHRGLDDRLAADRDDAVGDAAGSEDRRLRRIDDGVEGVDAVHAEVADGEAAALDVRGPQLTHLRARHEILAA